MSCYFSDTLRTARANAIVSALNGGTMKFYTATQPAKGAAITTQTLLATTTLSNPAGTVSNGVLTFSAIADDSSIDADGIATWVRLLDSGGTWVADMSVTDTNGAGPVKMASTQLYAGGILHVASAVITEGNG